jgi:hypothetical protein
MCVDQEAVVVSQAPEDSASPKGRGPSGVIPSTPAGPRPAGGGLRGLFPFPSSSAAPEHGHEDGLEAQTAY